MTDWTPPLSDSQRVQRAWAIAALSAILLLAFVMRAAGTQASYWADEIRTWEGATKPFTEGLVHSPYPLYYLLGHFALYLGDTEAVLRLPSVLCGVLGVWAMYFVLAALRGRMAGLVGALVLATNEFHVFFSREARFYALMMLVGLLMLWLLYRALVTGGFLNWFLFAITSAVGILAHLFMLPFYAALIAGAGAWLLVAQGPPTKGRRIERLAALVVFGTVGMSGFGALTCALGYFPTGLIYAPAEEGPPATAAASAPVAPAAGSTDAGANASPQPNAVSAPAPKEELFTLDMWQYIDYYRQFLRQWSMPWLCVLAVFWAWGFLWLWLRHRPMAVLLTALHVLMPLPFFFVTATHFYGARYFAPLLPATLLTLSYGMMDAIWLCGEGVRAGVVYLRRRAALPPNPANGWCVAAVLILVVALIAVATPTTVRAFERADAEFRTDYWHGDWKDAAGYVAQRLTADDVLVYAIPEEKMWEIGYPMDFYLRRLLSNSAVTLSATQYYYGALSAANFDEVLTRHPFATIYVLSVADEGLQPKFLARMEETGFETRTFGAVRVRTLGAPTTNQAFWGGFEGDEVAGLAGGPLSIVRDKGKGQVFDGARALRIHEPKRTSVRMVIPFRQSPCRLRNGSFEAWQEGQPVGWTATAADTLARALDARSGRYALALHVSEQQSAAAHQPLPYTFGPGDVIDLSAQGRAARPDQLAIAVTWRNAAGQPQEEKAACPGSGIWTPFALRVQLPQDIVPDSVAVEVRCAAGLAADVLVDDVVLQVDRQGLTFDPRQEYTLALRLKLKDVDLFDETFALGLAGTDAAGAPFTKSLLTLGGTRDWQECVFRIRPGIEAPLGARNVGLALYAYGPVGTVWLDNVQLEANARPTPFTQSSRPPHDELP